MHICIFIRSLEEDLVHLSTKILRIKLEIEDEDLSYDRLHQVGILL
jgi:hypothetical protein